MLKLRTIVALLVLAITLSAASSAATLERLYADRRRAPGYDIAVGDGFAYVSGNDGVSIYDIRDPEDVSLLTRPGWLGDAVFGLWLEGTILYAAAPERGLLIVDVADPANPEILGSYGGGFGDVFVYREVAYIGGFYTNLEAVDVSDPASPTSIRRFGWANPNGAAASGDFIYVTDPPRGIVTLDVSDPLHPDEVGVLVDSGGAYRLEVRGNWLVAAMYTRGLRVYDLADPRRPVLRHSVFDSGEAWDAAGEYPIYCIGDLQEGLEVVNVAAPYAERDLASDASVAPHSIEYADGYVHLADQDEGYVLFRLVLDP